MAPNKTTMSLISLALILPTALALPLEWPFFKSKPFEQPPWSFEAPHHHPHPVAYPSYTLTETSEVVFPTAPTAPTAYSYVAATTGLRTGTGTAAYPTATGYQKRDNVEERPFDFPLHFSGMPTFNFLTGTALPTGISDPYKVGTASGTGSSWPTSFPDYPFEHEHEHHEHWEYEGVEKRFGGPRHHFEPHYFPYRPGPMPSEAMPTMPSAPSGTAVAYYPTATAPSWSAPTGYPFPTGFPAFPW